MSALTTSAAAGPGRVCPLDYFYEPAEFARQAESRAEVLYVVGGLYGNLASLDAIETLANAESLPTTIVFNGDFHWFDAERDWFNVIDQRVSCYSAIRGNVETELSRDRDIGAGCGCAYPECVSETLVERSNAILRALREVATPEQAERLTRLPMHRVIEVGGLRVGIVHGDATSLAGWGFAHDRLDDPRARIRLRALQRVSHVDIFASSHTCLAAMAELSGPNRLTIVNNGAAGMPNFSGSRFGIITRIAVQTSPYPSLYGMARDGVSVDAIAVPYDTEIFLERFLARWPAGSPAHISYFGRIVEGPDHSIAAATLYAQP